MTDEEKRLRKAEYNRRNYRKHRERILKQQRGYRLRKHISAVMAELEAFEDFNRNYNMTYLDTERYEFDYSKFTNPKRPYRGFEDSHIDVNYGTDNKSMIGVDEE